MNTTAAASADTLQVIPHQKTLMFAGNEAITQFAIADFEIHVHTDGSGTLITTATVHSDPYTFSVPGAPEFHVAVTKR